jgi:hypothetical protein
LGIANTPGQSMPQAAWIQMGPMPSYGNASVKQQQVVSQLAAVLGGMPSIHIGFDSHSFQHKLI